MTTADKLQAVLSQYECVKLISQDTNGIDLFHLCSTSHSIWAASFAYLTTIKKNVGFGISCINADNDISIMTGTALAALTDLGRKRIECLDSISNLTKAKPCQQCGTAVCNVCRFHLYRSLDQLQSDDPDWQFDDEQDLKNNSRPVWRKVGYEQYPFILGASQQIQAEHILADSWRIYCNKHTELHKGELLRLSNTEGLCICNPLDQFVGRWLCTSCFDKEVAAVSYMKPRAKCCEEFCNRPADVEWKQCCSCKRLKEPYNAKEVTEVRRARDS